MRFQSPFYPHRPGSTPYTINLGEKPKPLYKATIEDGKAIVWKSKEARKHLEFLSHYREN